MKALCCFGKHSYGVPSRGLSPEYVAFVPAIESLGYTVELFDSLEQGQHKSYLTLNVALLEAILESKPDLFFCVHLQCEIWIETLTAARQIPNIKMVCWTTDDSWKYFQSSRFYAPFYDRVATTYDYMVAQYIKDGNKNVHLSQWAASRERLQPPATNGKYRYGVTFVGSAHGGRRRYIENLMTMGIYVECFGHGWEHGPVTTDEMYTIFNSSAISLNFANSRGRNQIKARTFEVPGAGGFLLTDVAPGIEEFFEPNEEIVCFGDIPDLAEKIRFYLGNLDARDRVASKGFSRVLTNHTYDVRVAKLLNFSVSSTVSLVRTDLTFSERQSAPLNIIRYLTSFLGSLLFGRNKGKRAAKRLIFELSWRLQGVRAFSSKGWSSRIFHNIE
jgi:spore maturation protein CgeB